MFGVNAIISLAFIKFSKVFLLEPQQNNLSNPEVYLEPCHAPKMEHFVKAVNN